MWQALLEDNGKMPKAMLTKEVLGQSLAVIMGELGVSANDRALFAYLLPDRPPTCLAGAILFRAGAALIQAGVAVRAIHALQSQGADLNALDQGYCGMDMLILGLSRPAHNTEPQTIELAHTLINAGFVHGQGHYDKATLLATLAAVPGRDYQQIIELLACEPDARALQGATNGAPQRVKRGGRL